MIVSGNGGDTSPAMGMVVEFLVGVWMDNVGGDGDAGTCRGPIDVYTGVIVVGSVGSSGGVVVAAAAVTVAAVVVVVAMECRPHRFWGQNR